MISKRFYEEMTGHEQKRKVRTQKGGEEEKVEWRAEK